MKKILFLVVAITLCGLILGPNLSFAISGACSSHGGVNCSALGAYATCNDGAQSSVFYTDVVECKKTKCHYPVGGGCSSQEQLQLLQSQKAQATSIANWRGYGDPDWVNQQIANALQEYDQKISQCEAQIEGHKAQQLAYQACLNSDKNYTVPTPIKISPNIPTPESCYATQAQHDKAVKDYFELSDKIIAKAQGNLNQALNGNYSGESVADKAIREINNDILAQYKRTMNCKIIKSRTSEEVCQAQFGLYAIPSPTQADYCKCQGGYEFSDEENPQCVLSPLPIPEPVPTPKISPNNPVKIPPKKTSSPTIGKPMDSPKEVVMPEIETQNAPIAPQETMQPTPTKRPFFQRVGLWFVNLFK